MKTKRIATISGLTRCVLLFSALLLAPPARAQFAVDWFTIDGGGGESSDGAYVVRGTIGQPDAGMSIGGPYALSGGFWGGLLVTSNPPPTLRIARDGANVLLAWPNPSAGFLLQESASLTMPVWTDVPTPPAVVGDEQQVTAPLQPGARFFRLRRP